MGALQASPSADFLYQNYQVVREEDQMKILEEKQTREQFALKELCFLNKPEYDACFKKIREVERQFRNVDNTLKIVKLWSKEHNGVCSNLFKIYIVYEYPRVKLIDQIEARKAQEKPFQEGELISILQSCINAFIADPSYLNISPSLIFIVPEGVLKLVSAYLADSHYQTAYNGQYYYSPEKMEDFQSIKLNEYQRQKQAAFSIGMTLLHSALLESPAMCYEPSLKRLSKKKLDHFKGKLNKKYSNALIQLIYGLLDWDPSSRLNFNQIQGIINEMCSETHYIHSFQQQNQETNSINKDQNDQFLDNSKQSHQKQERISSSNINNSEITLSTYLNPVRKSEFQIICDQTRKNSTKTQSVPIRKQQDIVIDKQNIFTDSSIIKMIKEGLAKIQKSTQQRQSMKELQSANTDNMPTKPTPVGSSQDLLSQYELKTISTQKDSIYIVQQYEDQSRYEGMIHSGVKHGFGKLVYPDGVFYEGNFKNDTLSGKGSLYYGPNRPAYVGHWQNNKFNGVGTLYNEYPVMMESGFDYTDFNKIQDQWIQFQGNFHEDIKEGMGKIVLTNGQHIQAMFEAGVVNGEGIFTDINGRILRGVWNGNKLVRIVQ